MIEQTHLDRYAAKIQADYDLFRRNSEKQKITVEFEWGAKFIKVVTSTYGQRGVHSFIAKGANPNDKWPEGTILKAAGWRAPAQNFARGSIYDKDLKCVHWTSAY